MKKFLCLLFSLILLSASYTAYGQSAGGSGGGGASATNNAMDIILYPGWNVVSTPYILSSLSFSNGGNGISFSKLQNGKRIDVPANITNIKPLEGYMAYNNNSENVTLTFSPKNNVSPTEAVLQKNLNFGWDLLGIVTTSSPFNNIGNAAAMSLDFTDNGSTNFLNRVNDNYAFNPTSSNITTPQLGEAYGIFINQQNAVYGGANGGGTSGGGDTGGGNSGGGDSGENNPTTDCSDSLIQVACSLEDSDECPIECRPENEKLRLTNKYTSDSSIVYGEYDAVIGKGKYTVRNPMLGTFSITARNNGVNKMYVQLGNEKYTSTKNVVGNDSTFTFSNVEFSDSGEIIFLVDMIDDSSLAGTNITFSPTQFDKYTFTEILESNQPVEDDAIVGSIPFKTFTIAQSKTTLTNGTSRADFPIGETNRLMVFNGNYTANTSSDIYLDGLYINGTPSSQSNNVTFYVSIGGSEYRVNGLGETNKIALPDIKVEAGKSTNIIIYAEIDAYNTEILDDFVLYVSGKDVANHTIGPVIQRLANIQIYDTNSIQIERISYNKVMRNTSDNVLAEFKVLPAGDLESAIINSLSFTIGGTIDPSKVKLKIDGLEEDINLVGSTYTAYPNYQINSQGVKIQVYLGESDIEGEFLVSDLVVNSTESSLKFKSYLLDALVYFISQQNNSDYTRFTMGVVGDSDSQIINLKIYADSDTPVIDVNNGEIGNGEEFSVVGSQVSRYITRIEYDIVNGTEVTHANILKSEYNDYFKIGTDYVRIYKVNN